jgi:hypothetical protein
LKVIKDAYTLLSFCGRLKGLHQGSLLKALLTHEGFGIPMKADPSKEPITVGAAVNMSIAGKDKSKQKKRKLQA